jgi:hypothetical protein
MSATIDEDVPMDKPMDVDDSTNGETVEGELMEVDDNINKGNPMDVD